MWTKFSVPAGSRPWAYLLGLLSQTHWGTQSAMFPSVSLESVEEGERPTGPGTIETCALFPLRSLSRQPLGRPEACHILLRPSSAGEATE